MLENKKVSEIYSAREFDALSEWNRLSGLFPTPAPLATHIEPVPFSVVPEPYKALFVHANHMTAVMERFHGSAVDVKVIARRIDADTYSRKIILTKHPLGWPVQFALAQFNLHSVSDAVRRDILSEQIPLGRVLTNHRVVCLVELKAVLRIAIGGQLAELLQCSIDSVTYGRIAQIMCDGNPTFDVIEVSAPLGTVV